MSHSNLALHTKDYARRLAAAVEQLDDAALQELAQALQTCWAEGRQIFLAGNGGSAGNAIHIANDLIYGAGVNAGKGLKAVALPANAAVTTCLANDLGYEKIFSEQLRVLAEPGDILIVLSGSGNSPNILKALEQADTIGVKSFAILGYSGGKARDLADCAIHVPVDDMQIAEDMQLIIGHVLMQWLCANLGQTALQKTA
jgi:D-sedoheptulose 7-phosphate isomerase